MANAHHLALLNQGVSGWNEWRKNNLEVSPDLSGAYLFDADLSGVDLHRGNLTRATLGRVNLSRANLSEADLSGANLHRADLSGANLSGAYLFDANLSGAYLFDANLSGANLGGAYLFEADLSRANLFEADLRKANLGGANLHRANLCGTDLRKANLNNCKIYGISVWDLSIEGAQQSNLTITPEGKPTIMVDDLEVAQFIYLLLNNEKIRHVIDTITSKVVLILGRFKPERKVVLDAIRDELRRRDYLPVLFDFDKPASRNITETISILAHMARFVIADITDAKSIPQELQRIVPDLPFVPVQPMLQTLSDEYGMFEYFKKYPWVLNIYLYENINALITSLKEKVIHPAEEKVKELKKIDKSSI